MPRGRGLRIGGIDGAPRARPRAISEGTTTGRPRARAFEPATGHRVLPHTADVILEAWGPDRRTCLAEAVLALVGIFAAPLPGAVASRMERTIPPGGGPAELLVGLLEEVIYLAEVEGVVPRAVTVDDDRASGGLRAALTVVPLADAERTGPAPKGIARHALEFAGGARGWRCRVVVDV